MYCGHEMLAATVEEIIQQARAHAQAEHGFREEDIASATIGLWRLHIRDLHEVGQPTPS